LIHEMSFARWRHSITARGSDWDYPGQYLVLRKAWQSRIVFTDVTFVEMLNIEILLIVNF